MTQPTPIVTAPYPFSDRPSADYGSLRWPAAAALTAAALVLWRVGMDGISAEQALAHAALCLGAGAPEAGIATLFGHCAACYAGLSAAAAGLALAMWPRRIGLS